MNQLDGKGAVTRADFLRMLTNNAEEYIKDKNISVNLSQSDTKKCSEVYFNAIIKSIKSILLENKEFNIMGFGKFFIHTSKETTRINPKTGERLSIPSKKYSKLKFSSSFNKILNE